MTLKLQKFISQSMGISRRKAAELIKNGDISVNGQQVHEPWLLVEEQEDRIRLGHKPLRVAPTARHYFALYKPKNCLTTLADPEGRSIISQFFPKGIPGLFPVGRLDYDAEGLILLTNDGNWANTIAHPSLAIEKRYFVKIKGLLSPADIQHIRRGPLLDGKKSKPVFLRVLRTINDKTWLEIGLKEGKYRQIKRMFADLGYRTLKIKRFRIGHILVDQLQAGEYRRLSEDEITPFMST